MLSGMIEIGKPSRQPDAFDLEFPTGLSLAERERWTLYAILRSTPENRTIREQDYLEWWYAVRIGHKR